MSAQIERDMSVHLVEDDQDHVLLITRAIKEIGPGTRVEWSADGERALVALREKELTPDLVLLDINMPGLSGLQVLEHVKQDPHLKHIPVVMLTSSDLSEDIARAYELGASGYISKPNQHRGLRAVLGNTLLYWSAMRRVPAGGDIGV